MTDDTQRQLGELIAECALLLGADNRTVWQEDVLATRSYT